IVRAEDGIRDRNVTGVQTCALPIIRITQRCREGTCSMHKVKGVVSMAKDAPVTVETILVPDPGPGEALVDVLTCGVCQTDVHYKVGGVNDDFPFLLGHEATGIVSAVGDDVTDLAP